MNRRDLLKAFMATPAIFLASKYGLPNGDKLDKRKLQDQNVLFPGFLNYQPAVEVQYGTGWTGAGFVFNPSPNCPIDRGHS